MTSAALIRDRLFHDTRAPLQRLLARQALWDEVGRQLVVDLSCFDRRLEPVVIPDWERMLTMNTRPTLPDWPLLSWPQLPAIQRWQRSLPDWVADTLRRLPQRHQLSLMYLCARYPQMLEMLEKAPVMAWRIADSGLPEDELTTYFPQPRAQLAARLGWPARRETMRFLSRLRLRRMDEPMLTQVEACLRQPRVLEKVVHLPRINAMALTLSAHFPDLIDTPLHHSLARQPCRPEQCRALHACVDDALALAQWLGEPPDRISLCRFMVEIEEIYRKWLENALKQGACQHAARQRKIDPRNFGGTPSDWLPVETEQALLTACEKSGHGWFVEYARGDILFQHRHLPLVCALRPGHVPVARTARNSLPDSDQLTLVSLLAAAIAFEPPAAAS